MPVLFPNDSRTLTPMLKSGRGLDTLEFHVINTPSENSVMTHNKSSGETSLVTGSGESHIFHATPGSI